MKIHYFYILFYIVIFSNISLFILPSENSVSILNQYFPPKQNHLYIEYHIFKHYIYILLLSKQIKSIGLLYYFDTMRLSKRGEYGLRAMLVLAEHATDGISPVMMQIKEISRREQIPAKFLEQILLEI